MPGRIQIKFSGALGVARCFRRFQGFEEGFENFQERFMWSQEVSGIPGMFQEVSGVFRGVLECFK